MNKPFEVCLQLVLPATAAGAFGRRRGAASKGKGQLQTGIEDLVCC